MISLPVTDKNKVKLFGEEDLGEAMKIFIIYSYFCSYRLNSGKRLLNEIKIRFVEALAGSRFYPDFFTILYPSGGLFNRTVNVHIGDRSAVTIKQQFSGRDIYHYFKAQVSTLF